MKFSKIAAVSVACILLSGTVFAQTTVEDEYLSSIEDAIITELAASVEYDNKLVALQYLEDAINAGRSSPEMVAALRSLAGEGVTTESRTNGRLMNNYPDIRRDACDLLGRVGGEQAKNTLVYIAQNDTEPMVVGAAIHALGEIGINNGDEVVAMIEYIEHKFAALNPTGSLAKEVLDAYAKLAPTVQDRAAMIESITQIATNYRYPTVVRQQALQLLKTIQTGTRPER